MTINEWVKEIHENAVAHGWWEDERSFAEVAALCHSELSEALEADRKGEDLVYIAHGKPEGIAVEMMDCVIRIFDWMGKEGVDAELILKMNMVNHPPHYTDGSVECIDAIRASMGDEAYEGFLKGQVMKYMWRYEKKRKPAEDLAKAEWYLQRMIALWEEYENE